MYFTPFYSPGRRKPRLFTALYWSLFTGLRGWPYSEEDYRQVTAYFD